MFVHNYLISLSTMPPNLTVTPVFITFAGLPATTVLSGTSFVTTLPAPTITESPTFTPGRMMERTPITQCLPITVSAIKSLHASCVKIIAPLRTRVPSPIYIPRGLIDLSRWAFHEMRHCSPIFILYTSRRYLGYISTTVLHKNARNLHILKPLIRVYCFVNLINDFSL